MTFTTKPRPEPLHVAWWMWQTHRHTQKHWETDPPDYNNSSIVGFRTHLILLRILKGGGDRLQLIHLALWRVSRGLHHSTLRRSSEGSPLPGVNAGAVPTGNQTWSGFQGDCSFGSVVQHDAVIRGRSPGSVENVHNVILIIYSVQMHMQAHAHACALTHSAHTTQTSYTYTHYTHTNTHFTHTIYTQHIHSHTHTHTHTYNGLALAYINNEDGLENQWWSSEFSAAHFHFSSREIKVSAFLL